MKGEADVVFKGLIAATAAVALSATPAIAAGNTNIAPASETVSGSEQMSTSGWIIAAFAVLAAIGGIVAAASGGDDAPVSP
jgi:hypothetical protein